MMYDSACRNIQTRQIHRDGRPCKGYLLLRDYRVSVWGSERVWKLNSSDGYTTLRLTSDPQLTPKNGCSGTSCIVYILPELRK